MRHSSPPDSSDLGKLPKLNLSAIFRLLSLGRPYRTTLIFSALLTLVTTGVSLFMPILAQHAVADVQSGGIPALDHAGLLAAGLLMVSGVVGFFNYLMIAKVGNQVVMETRLNLFAALQRLPVSFFDTHRSGDLTSVLSNDVSLLQSSLTDDLVKVGGNLLQLTGGIILALIIDWQLTLFVVALLVLTMAYFVVFGIRLRKLSRKGLDELSLSMGGMTEALANVRLVKAFTRENFEDSKAKKGLGKVFALNLKAIASEAMMTAVASAGSALMLTGVVWYGGRSVLEHRLTTGNLLAFIITVAIISGPMASLASLYTRLQRAVGAADRIFQFMDEKPEVLENLEGKDFPNPKHPSRVEFQNVEFRYREDVPIIQNLNLTLLPGKVTAIVGASGAGKTTIASLLYRFHELNSGKITIEGADIQDIQLLKLRENIGLVPQDTVLFNGTVRENIRYGKLEATDAEIEHAAKLANLEEFLNQLPERYETMIGERGVTLSGGQRQRVAIARVILKDPKILILDEATSALDTVSESLVRDALEKVMEGRTTMVIAHRLTTIQSADQIAVIDAGTVIELGTHKDLLTKGGKYAELYKNLEREATELSPIMEPELGNERFPLHSNETERKKPETEELVV